MTAISTAILASTSILGSAIVFAPARPPWHRQIPRVVGMWLLIFTSAWCVDDPYAAWGHGRPQDAIAELHRQATTSNRWDAWFDLGLAACAAGRQGDGAAWLVTAHRLAPERLEPRQALRAAQVNLPLGWLDRLGPLALPGLGWLGLTCIALGGITLGFACAIRGRRTMPVLIGGALLLSALPGRIAWEHDHARQLVVTVRNSQLYDSSGHPIAAIAAATVLEQESLTAWAERILVHDEAGQRGHLPLADTIAQP